MNCLLWIVVFLRKESCVDCAKCIKIITIKMDRKLILVIGSSNTDMSVKSVHLPRPGETVLGDGFRMGQGGKGANQAVAARKLDGAVAFVCKVGNDVFGKNAVGHYSECGIDTSHILYSDKPSGVALITVDDNAENAIVVASGANADITVNDIDGMADLIRSAGILLLQLEIPVAAVTRAASIAREAGVMVVLNPAPAAELPEELLKCVDVLIPNEAEASALTGIDIENEEDAAKAADALKSEGVGSVIITMGSSGSFVSGKDSFKVPARKVKAVDTVAAGDTFCGALCVALAEGMSLADSVEFATAASSISVQRHGAQESVPSREEVKALMSRNLQ